MLTLTRAIFLLYECRISLLCMTYCSFACRTFNCDVWAAFTSTQSHFSQSRQWKQKTQFDDIVKKRGTCRQSPLLMKIYPVSLSVAQCFFSFPVRWLPSTFFDISADATGKQMNNTVTLSKLTYSETLHILSLNEGSDLTLGQLIMTRQILPSTIRPRIYLSSPYLNIYFKWKGGNLVKVWGD